MYIGQYLFLGNGEMTCMCLYGTCILRCVQMSIFCLLIYQVTQKDLTELSEVLVEIAKEKDALFEEKGTLEELKEDVEEYKEVREGIPMGLVEYGVGGGGWDGVEGGKTGFKGVSYVVE